MVKIEGRGRALLGLGPDDALPAPAHLAVVELPLPSSVSQVDARSGVQQRVAVYWSLFRVRDSAT